jgi:hypothetical protein
VNGDTGTLLKYELSTGTTVTVWKYAALKDDWESPTGGGYSGAPVDFYPGVSEFSGASLYHYGNPYHGMDIWGSNTTIQNF